MTPSLPVRTHEVRLNETEPHEAALARAAEITKKRTMAADADEHLRGRREQKARAKDIIAELKQIVKEAEAAETASLNAADTELADVLRPVIARVRDLLKVAANPGRDLIDAIVLADFMPKPPKQNERERQVYKRLIETLGRQLYLTRRDYSAAVWELAETVDGLNFHVSAMRREGLTVEPELDELAKVYRKLAHACGTLKRKVTE